MSGIDYCESTDMSVCVILFGKPFRRRVWRMLADDKPIGLKKGDLVISDPISQCGKKTPVKNYLVLEWYECESGVKVKAEGGRV